MGTFLWLAVVTGARRGELVALRWTDIRWAESDLLIQRGYVTRPGQRIIQDTRSHQKRRLSLDPATIEILRAHLKRQEDVCGVMGVPFRADGYVFTRDGLGEEPWLPDSVTQRFDRLRDHLGIACRLRELRHRTATQLLAAGVGFRSVPGRVGDSRDDSAVVAADLGRLEHRIGTSELLAGSRRGRDRVRGPSRSAAMLRHRTGYR